MSGDIGGGSRTPSTWARRGAPSPSRHAGFSDMAPSPPESPGRFEPNQYGGQSDYAAREYPYDRRSDVGARSSFQSYTAPPYEHPGYTVETPGIHDDASASPYRPQPYFVQTPTRSDGGIRSPFSSAPSSPPHYGPNGELYRNGDDTRSTRGSRSLNPMKALRPSRPLHTMTTVDDDDDDFPDPEGDRRHARNNWILCFWITLLLAIVAVCIGALVIWLLYKPSKPTYKLQDVSIQQFDVRRAGLDTNGLNTNTVHANMTVQFEVHNPNTRFGIKFLGGTMTVYYKSLPLIDGPVGQFEQGQHNSTNFTTLISAVSAPLYGSGPFMLRDVKVNNVTLIIEASFKAHIDVAWHIITSTYRKYMDCVVIFTPSTLLVTYTNCTSSTGPVLGTGPNGN
eukprot:jgi/Mesen1/9252/ME000006S09251